MIGSVWSNVSGDNKAFVTSAGTQFGPFTDEPDDLWCVVCAGVNFFAPGANTSIFGKVDVAFGDQTEGFAAPRRHALQLVACWIPRFCVQSAHQAHVGYWHLTDLSHSDGHVSLQAQSGL